MPSDSAPHSRYNFSANVDSVLAEKAFRNIPKEEFIRNFQESGKELISKSFNLKLKEISDPYDFAQREDGKFSFLLRGCRVPGDACDFGIDGLEYGNIIKKPDKIKKMYNVEYVPHNIDNHVQAFTLLALWTEWANFLEIFKED